MKQNLPLTRGAIERKLLFDKGDAIRQTPLFDKGDTIE